MKKIIKYCENVIQNPAEKKYSQPVFFEDRDESVSLIQIGNKINLVAPLVCSQLQQKAAHRLIQYLKK
jgi:hypothetical protein